MEKPKTFSIMRNLTAPSRDGEATLSQVMLRLVLGLPVDLAMLPLDILRDANAPKQKVITIEYRIGQRFIDSSGLPIPGLAAQVALEGSQEAAGLYTKSLTSSGTGEVAAVLAETQTLDGPTPLDLARRVTITLGKPGDLRSDVFGRGEPLDVREPLGLRYAVELKDDAIRVQGERLDMEVHRSEQPPRDELVPIWSSLAPAGTGDVQIRNRTFKSDLNHQNAIAAAERQERAEREAALRAAEAERAEAEARAKAERVAAEDRAKEEQQSAERKEWAAAGFYFGDGRVCGYSSRDCAPRWQEAGIGLEEAREWRKANFQPETAVAWKQAGLTARDAEGWAGFTLDAMRAWKAAGFDGTAAQALKGAKLDLDTAKTWREAGFDADATVSWRRKGFSLQAASAAKETCPKGIERLSTLVQTNPFDVEGRCFEFAAQTLQIIDRTHALYILSPELDPYYVEFTTRSAPPMGFQGFVVGVGTFSYVATSGVDKVVPHLQQLDLGR